MGKVTKVFNDTGATIELRQGSANVFLLLDSVPKDESYRIKVDESATYREYWCAVQPVESDNSVERVVFSSDDCAEYSKVRIYKDDHGKYQWKGTEKRGAVRNTPVPSKSGPTLVEDADRTPTPGQEADASQDADLTRASGHNGDTPTKWQQFTGLFRKKFFGTLTVTERALVAGDRKHIMVVELDMHYIVPECQCAGLWLRKEACS